MSNYILLTSEFANFNRGLQAIAKVKTDSRGGKFLKRIIKERKKQRSAAFCFKIKDPICEKIKSS